MKVFANFLILSCNSSDCVSLVPTLSLKSTAENILGVWSSAYRCSFQKLDVSLIFSILWWVLTTTTGNLITAAKKIWVLLIPQKILKNVS